MHLKKKNKFNYCLLPLLGAFTQASADYKTDVGYTQLKNELGAALADGLGVKVTQVEASTGTDPANPIFAPDPTVSALSDKEFSYPTLNSIPRTYSSHATGVALTFYGTNVSMAPAIDDIHSYETNRWLTTLRKSNGQATTTDRRIANHSWVGKAATAADNGLILRLVDRQVELNEYIQIVASGASSPLLSNGYNTMAVGLSNTATGYTSVNLDSIYQKDRVVTNVVAPAANLSSATPIVAAAAALLVQTGHEQPSLSEDATSLSGVGTIYNAERSETIKAALLAGAARQTSNTSGYGDISDYRSTGHQTENGLDTRYGAGQLNVYNSYQIITGGEQNSFEDDATGLSQIGYAGFDYDANFGGASGSNATATYSFTAYASETISASLVWNAGVSNNTAMDTTIHHLGLSLFDVSDNTVIAKSESMLDNTQNIHWQNLIAGHEYQLLVSSLEETNSFNWDYALAWNRTVNSTPVPLPAAFWLFGSALAGLVGYQRKQIAA